jgi:hypothetical protein
VTWSGSLNGCFCLGRPFRPLFCHFFGPKPPFIWRIFIEPTVHMREPFFFFPLLGKLGGSNYYGPSCRVINNYKRNQALRKVKNLTSYGQDLCSSGSDEEIPCTLSLEPCTLSLAPCTLHLAPCTLHLLSERTRVSAYFKK